MSSSAVPCLVSAPMSSQNVTTGPRAEPESSAQESPLPPADCNAEEVPESDPRERSARIFPIQDLTEAQVLDIIGEALCQARVFPAHVFAPSQVTRCLDSDRVLFEIVKTIATTPRYEPTGAAMEFIAKSVDDKVSADEIVVGLARSLAEIHEPTRRALCLNLRPNLPTRTRTVFQMAADVMLGGVLFKCAAVAFRYFKRLLS